MNNTAKTILLVEDDAIIALSEKKTIEKQGYNVVHALTGEDAVRLMSISDNGIDLILMDIDLGQGIDGTEAAQIILKGGDIPVIFLSSHAEPDVIDKVEKITSYGYILKGSDPAVLFASVRMAFRLFDANINLKNSYVAILNEITERKKAEEKLKYSYELLKYFIKHAQAAIAIHDREMRYLYVSDRYIKDYRVNDSDIIGKHHYDVFPDLPEKWRKVHQLALQGVVSNGDEDPFPREDGSLDWTKWECRPWHDIEGNIGGIIVYTEVITDKVNTLLELKQYISVFEKARWEGGAAAIEDYKQMLSEKEELLREKEILLKETHHRVKNNLQIISSLLGLQSELINKKNYVDAFSDSCSRVRSMAIVHEMLYKKGDFSRIDFKDYSDQLISFLRSSLGSKDLTITTEYGESEITLIIDVAINLGLILNELISNAIKYAGSAGGESIVRYKAFAEDGCIFISVSDNGPGISKEKFFSDSETLGLTLVKSLIGQLKGEIDLVTDGGTEFRLKIPLKPRL